MGQNATQLMVQPAYAAGRGTSCPLALPTAGVRAQEPARKESVICGSFLNVIEYLRIATVETI
jgi:hypothetical protein